MTEPQHQAVMQESVSQGLLDLTRQQRNLLLLRPIFQLELNKLRMGDELKLFEGIDTHYLALNALDQMMEGTTVALGRTRGELLEHLMRLALAMKPELTTAQQETVSRLVLDSLDNSANGLKKFVFEYFDAVKGEKQSVSFKLVDYEPDMEDVYRYRPTSEGYLVYLGMLDMAPEDSQEMMEKMLDLLMERGRFDDALEIAKRARTLSIEYRQRIRDRLQQAYRAPGSINWTRDMQGELEKARTHVRMRQQEDQRMEESVLDTLRLADEPRSRMSLAQLLTTLQGASLLRAQLIGDISAAPERFLDAQRHLFRARRPMGLPDLDGQLLPQLFNLPTTVLADHADDVSSCLYPTIWPKLYDLDSLFALLLERNTAPASPEDDSGELVTGAVVEEQFPEDLVQDVSRWMAEKFSRGTPVTLSELLTQAAQEDLDARARRCLVLVAYRSFAPSESEFKNVTVEVTGFFHADVAQGANLRFIPRTE